MNDRAISLLEQYEIEVLGTRKGRGAFICETDRGTLIFKEYSGNEDRVAIQNELLCQIEKQGSVAVESILHTKEGALTVRDGDGINYLLKTYREGRECNIYDQKERQEAVEILARLHESMVLFRDSEREGDLPAFSQLREYEKRNKELRRVRRYLRQKPQRSDFERSLLNAFDYFFEQALQVTEEWEHYQTIHPCNEDFGMNQGMLGHTYCHGDYQYHNILRCDEEWFIINFEKYMMDDPIRDLYLLMRKLLEKSDWSVEQGREILEVYEGERSISAMSKIDLYYRLFYPEKFWKIVNFYFNSRKSWIPEKYQEKLDKLVEQEPEKQAFLEEVFRRVV